jgi:hypothetical protein
MKKFAFIVLPLSLVITATINNFPAFAEELTTDRISNGQYWNGDPDGGLEVKGNKYRYIDPGQPAPWHPISDLRKISKEII